MRVLFWQETFLPYIGGIEVLAPKLISGLGQRGYEFAVATRQDSFELPADDQHDGIPIHRYPFWNAFADGNVAQLLQIRSDIAKLKRSFAPDLVHINSIGPSAMLHHETAHVHTAPLLVTLHTTDRPMLQQSSGRDGLFGRTLRSADWVSCVSVAVHTHWCQVVPEIVKTSSVIYNGVKPTALLPDPLPLRSPRLLCLGRLCADKGFDLALRAFALLIDRFPAARLIIAGDGIARAALEHLAVELGLRHAIDFVGWVPPDKVPELINSATILVMPSRREGLPTVAIEAGMLARPVVGTRIGGMPEIVNDQESGMLVEPEDWKGLAQAIALLLDHPDTAISLGQAAQRRVQHLFSFARYVDAYDALYRKLTGVNSNDGMDGLDHSDAGR